MGSNPFKSTLKIVLGDYFDGPYRRCIIKDNFPSGGNLHKQYACQEVGNTAEASTHFEFTMQNTSKWILKSYAIVKHEGRFYAVYENFTSTLKTWIENLPDSDVTLKTWIECVVGEMIEGVEQLHQHFQIAHGNISMENIFIVQNNSERPRVKFGKVEAKRVTDSLTDISVMDDHESVWSIVGILYSKIDANVQRSHHIGLKKRCTCSEFKLYLYHPERLDADQACFTLMYLTTLSNYDDKKVKTIQQSLHDILISNPGKAITDWNSRLHNDYLTINPTKPTYSIGASGFLFFCMDSLNHMVHQNQITIKRSNADFCSDFQHAWPEFMCLLFDALIESNMWSYGEAIKEKFKDRS